MSDNETPKKGLLDGIVKKMSEDGRLQGHAHVEGSTFDKQVAATESSELKDYRVNEIFSAPPQRQQNQKNNVPDFVVPKSVVPEAPRENDVVDKDVVDKDSAQTATLQSLVEEKKRVEEKKSGTEKQIDAEKNLDTAQKNNPAQKRKSIVDSVVNSVVETDTQEKSSPTDISSSAVTSSKHDDGSEPYMPAPRSFKVKQPKSRSGKDQSKKSILDDVASAETRHEVDPLRNGVVPEVVEEEKPKRVVPSATIPILSGNFPTHEDALKILEQEDDLRRNRKNRAAAAEEEPAQDSTLLPQTAETAAIDLPEQAGEYSDDDDSEYYEEGDYKERNVNIKNVLTALAALVAVALLGFAGWGLKSGKIKLPSQQASQSVIVPTASATSVSASSGTGGTVGVADLKNGDCIANWADSNDNNAQYQVVSCTQAHNAEVFHVETSIDLGQAGYPGDTATSTAVQQICESQVNTTKNPALDFTAQNINVFWTHPNEASFLQGDRKAACFFVSPTAVTTKLTNL